MWISLSPPEHGVGRKTQSFQRCPHLLCKKASLHSPETWLLSFVQEQSSLLFPCLSLEKKVDQRRKKIEDDQNTGPFLVCSKGRVAIVFFFFYVCVLRRPQKAKVGILVLKWKKKKFSFPEPRKRCKMYINNLKKQFFFKTMKKKFPHTLFLQTGPSTKKKEILTKTMD